MAITDQNSFDEIFIRHFPGLLAYAKTYIPYPSDEAEDLVSEVFYTLWKNRDNHEIQGHLAPYLYTAVKNKVYDYYKKRRLQFSTFEVPEQDQLNPRYLEPDALLSFKELNQRINLLIANLPPQCKLIFQMNRNDGLTYEQIAELLNLSVNSVKTQMYRAIKYLKMAYETSEDINSQD